MAEKIVKRVVIEVDDKGSLKRTSKDSQTLNRNMKGVSRQSSNASKNFSKTAQGMQGVLVPAYAEVAARVFALSAAFHALSEAANYNILVQGQQAFAKMTGKNMARIAKSVQIASKHMLDFKEASTSVALASTSGISSKQIVAMTKAAVDSSSALGRSVQDTMDRLTRGIVKAEPEILDEIGVIIRLDRVYKDYAESVSKSTAELTEGEKATARYNAIMGQLESKFGGIADTLDPNYFAALSATVLDIIRDVSSFSVKHLAGPLKFLTESKLVLVAIMALITKSLVGKIFPAFTSFGAKISDMPGKMQTKVDGLKKGISKLKNEIKGSRVELENFNKMTKGGRMTKGMQQARGAGDIGKYAQLESAAIKRAQKSLGPEGKGTVKGGIYQGLNSANLKSLEQQVISLGETQTRYNTKRNIELKQHGVSVKSLQLRYANLKLGIAKFGAQQMQLLNMGFVQGIVQVGKNWQTTGTLASYALNSMKAGLSVVTVLVRGLATALNKLFKYFMWLTMIGTMVKSVVSIWHDFDTKFAKASEAAGTLNTELKNILDDLEDRPVTINFDGVAKNFADSLKNAEFAANLADEIYTATHKAMKHLGKELGEMNWFDQLLNKIKDVLNLETIESKMREVLKTSIKLAEISGSALPKGLQNAVDAARKETQPLIEAKQAQISLNNNNANLQAATRDYNNKQLNKDIELLKEGVLNKALAGLKLPQMTKLAGEIDKINEGIVEGAAKHTASVKELGQAYAKAGKVQKAYKESLISKSVFYDLAKAQQTLQNLLDDTDITPLQKMNAAIAASYIKIKEGSKLYKATEDRKSAEKLMDVMNKGHGKDYKEEEKENHKKHVLDLIKIESDLTIAMYEEKMKAEDYLGWNAKLAHQNELTAIRKKLGLEHRSKNLKIFGSTALREQSEIQQTLLRQEVTALKYKIEIGNLDKDALAIAKEMLRIKENEVTRAGAIALKEAEHTAKVEGRKLSILEKYAARRKDLVTSNALKQEFDLLGDEQAEAIYTFFTKYIEGLDKSIKLTRLLTQWTENFGEASEQQQADTIKAQKYAIRNTSYKGMNLTPTMMEEAIKDSGGMSLGTSHKKLSREMELKNQDRAYRKHKVLLDLEFKLAKIKDKRIDEELKLLESKWEVEMELMKAQEAERDALWKERAQKFGGAMKTIADSFGSAISNYYNDIFMNKKPEEGAFRNTLAQGFAGAASNMIGQSYQKTVFGNKGLLSSAAGAMGVSPEWLETLFPQTELEMAKERTDYLRQIRNYFINGGVVSGAGDLLNTSSVVESITEDLTEGVAVVTSTITSLFSGKVFGSRLELLGKGSGTNLTETFLGTLINGILLAKGGVAPGGFRAFAHGGIANKPTLGMIGEGKYNEAVVPLPDGKSIPVKGAGSNNNVTVNVAIDSDGRSKTETDGGGNAKELGYLVSQAVQSELVEQQRPGGLLSAY